MTPRRVVVLVALGLALFGAAVAVEPTASACTVDLLGHCIGGGGGCDQDVCDPCDPYPGHLGC